MTSQQIPRKPNAEEGFCEPNDLELRFWMTTGQQDTGSAMQRTRKVGALFVHCTYCDVDSASWEVEEDELCRIHIENLHFVGFLGVQTKKIIWSYTSLECYGSQFSFGTELLIFEAAYWPTEFRGRTRTDSLTHPDTVSWHHNTSTAVHCALCAYCGRCRMWRVCVKTKNIVVTLCPNMVHLCIGLAISCCCARLSSNSEQKPKAGWGHCGLSGWAIKFWYVVNMVAKQVSYATLTTGFDHQKKSYSEDVIEKLLKPMQ